MDELIPWETNEDTEPACLLFFFTHHLKCLFTANRHVEKQDVNDGQHFVQEASFQLHR